jgi:hypothetical protein
MRCAPISRRICTRPRLPAASGLPRKTSATVRWRGPRTGGRLDWAGREPVGAQNNLRYAVFPDTRRLVINDQGATTVYDTGSHRIFGVAQAQSSDQTPSFTSQDGLVRGRRPAESSPLMSAAAPALAGAEIPIRGKPPRLNRFRGRARLWRRLSRCLALVHVQRPELSAQSVIGYRRLGKVR